MRIGIFSDVHGDLDGLRRVWHALEGWGLTDVPVLNAGDNVGYGNAPEECVRFIRERPQIVSVRGNYDKNVARFPAREEAFRKKWGRDRPEKFQAIREASNTISGESREWLEALPQELRVSVGGHTVYLTHYAPGSKEGLTPWTPKPHLAELALVARADAVVCGHTHMAFMLTVEGTLFVNPGAVGRSDGAISFAVLTLNEGSPPTAEVFRIS